MDIKKDAKTFCEKLKENDLGSEVAIQGLSIAQISMLLTIISNTKNNLGHA